MKYVCKYCGKFDFQRQSDFSYHQNRCELNPCSEKYRKFHQIRVCEKCGKSFENKSLWSLRRFCSKSCANSHEVSEEQKKKTSETLLAKSRKFPRPVCKDCGKELCLTCKSGYCREHVNKHRVTTEAQRERYREIGKQNAAKHDSRSKNEIRFFELIQEKFPDALPNEPMFNGWDADIVIPSKKIAILWNGAWHYKDLLGGLKKIQNRDKIKYKEIVKKGYMPYIVVDFTSGKESTVQKELKRFEQFLQWL